MYCWSRLVFTVFVVTVEHLEFVCALISFPAISVSWITDVTSSPFMCNIRFSNFVNWKSLTLLKPKCSDNMVLPFVKQHETDRERVRDRQTDRERERERGKERGLVQRTRQCNVCVRVRACVRVCVCLERALSHFCLAQSIFSMWWNKICLNQDNVNHFALCENNYLTK